LNILFIVLDAGAEDYRNTSYSIQDVWNYQNTT